MAWPWRHSKLDPDGARDLPNADHARLLNYLGVGNPQAWAAEWLASDVIDNTIHLWPDQARSDWLWSLGLPLLTEAKRKQGQRWLIGFSALPGCGKTSLGRWLEAAADRLGLSVQVVSIDDFYYAADALDRSMRGNPWGVPRALPGSHELHLLNSTLQDWKAGEAVDLPVFDKALRSGRGDRSGWRRCAADVLVLEGWFVGIRPMAGELDESEHSTLFQPPLADEEQVARRAVQRTLQDYLSVWDRLDGLWQLRTLQWNSPAIWKRQQEQQMLQERGAGLSSKDLDGFIRMIATAIPEASFNQINADVCLDVDPERRLRQLRVRPDVQDSLSSASATG